MNSFGRGIFIVAGLGAPAGGAISKSRSLGTNLGKDSKSGTEEEKVFFLTTSEN